MTDLQQREQEKNVLRWGGISGLLSGVLSILVIVIVAIFIPTDPTNLKEWVTRFPDIAIARTIENIVYLTALLFVIPFIIALHRALKKTNLAPSLFGCSLSIIGLTSMAMSATPHVAHYKISNLFQTLELGTQDQATIAIVWQAIWGIFDTMLYVGFFIVPIGFILLGIAMFNTPSFGKGFGLTSQILGIIGFIAAILQIIDPASAFGAISFFSIIFYCFIIGSKVYRISRN